MRDDDPTPAGAAAALARPDDQWPSAPADETDTFDLLGSEIAALLRSTHEISDRTRLEAEAEAAARLAQADLDAAQRLAEAEARLADVHRQAEQRLAETDRQVEERLAAIVGREESAVAVFELATELVKRLEQRLTRIAAEGRAATADLAPLKAALKRGDADGVSTTKPVAEPTAHDPGEVLIDLREDDAPAARPTTSVQIEVDVEVDTDPLPKRKGKHKRRRKEAARVLAGS